MLARVLWVREHAHDPRCTLIIGNHDVHYRWPDNETLIYPGYTKEKATVINQVLKPKRLERNAPGLHGRKPFVQPRRV